MGDAGLARAKRHRCLAADTRWLVVTDEGQHRLEMPADALLSWQAVVPEGAAEEAAQRCRIHPCRSLSCLASHLAR